MCACTAHRIEANQISNSGICSVQKQLALRGGLRGIFLSNLSFMMGADAVRQLTNKMEVHGSFCVSIGKPEYNSEFQTMRLSQHTKEKLCVGIFQTLK